jgi:hypothetical protein
MPIIAYSIGNTDNNCFQNVVRKPNIAKIIERVVAIATHFVSATMQ